MSSCSKKCSLQCEGTLMGCGVACTTKSQGWVLLVNVHYCGYGKGLLLLLCISRKLVCIAILSSKDLSTVHAGLPVLRLFCAGLDYMTKNIEVTNWLALWLLLNLYMKYTFVHCLYSKTLAHVLYKNKQKCLIML